MSEGHGRSFCPVTSSRSQCPGRRQEPGARKHNWKLGCLHQRPPLASLSFRPSRGVILPVVSGGGGDRDINGGMARRGYPGIPRVLATAREGLKARPRGWVRWLSERLRSRASWVPSSPHAGGPLKEALTWVTAKQRLGGKPQAAGTVGAKGGKGAGESQAGGENVREAGPERMMGTSSGSWEGSQARSGRASQARRN